MNTRMYPDSGQCAASPEVVRPSRLMEVYNGIQYSEERAMMLENRMGRVIDEMLGALPLDCPRATVPGNLSKIEAEPPLVDRLVRANTRVSDVLERCHVLLQRLESL